MNSRALTEVYDIITLMDYKYQNQIPIKLKEFIKNNRDSLYHTGIIRLPDTVDSLQEDTKIFLGIIYEKYFLNTKLDISDEKKKKIIQEIEENKFVMDDNQKTFENQQEALRLLPSYTFMDKIKHFFSKIKEFFIK